MKILMLLFGRREEGTYYRAFPWARHLAAGGHAVTLMCVSPARRFIPLEEQADGVRIIETPNLGDGRGLLRKLSGLAGWGPLDLAARVREIRRGGYDLVHTFEHHCNVALPVYLAGRRGAPVLVADWCDHYGPGGFRQNGKRPRLEPVYTRLGLPLRAGADSMERRLRLRADGVTVISRYLEERALALGVPESNIRRIPGSAEIGAIHPLPKAEARAKLGVDPRQHVAAFFGAAQFDVDIALDAFARVAASDPQALLLLMGAPDHAVERHITERGLTRRVRRTGWVAEPLLPAWLACADVFLLPMRDTPVNRARWPNKIGFYMAAARPTVCSDVGDVAGVVRGEGIGLVVRGGAGAFAEGILQLFLDPGAAAGMGRRAREVAEQKFDIAVQGRALEDAYRSFTARASACGRVGATSCDGGTVGSPCRP